MSKISLIIAGAGRSTRFASPVVKIFVQIGPKPVFLWAIDRFAGFPEIIQRLLVVAAENLPTVARQFGPQLHQRNVQLLAGGPRRFDSVKNALALVNPSADLIAVHDAARPAVSPQLIAQVFAAAAASGAAIAARQVSETIKKVDPTSRLTHLDNRLAYWLAQTPQVFARQLLIDAYAAWPADAPEPTDDAQVVEAFGTKPFPVPAGPDNIKITTPDDLKLLQSLLMP